MMNSYIEPDKKSFLFNLRSNGRLKSMMKFPVESPQHTLMIYDEENEWLLSIGDGGNDNHDDITIMKNDQQNEKPGNGCKQKCFRYYGNKNALCGSEVFEIKHLLVYQMK